VIENQRQVFRGCQTNPAVFENKVAIIEHQAGLERIRISDEYDGAKQQAGEPVTVCRDLALPGSGRVAKRVFPVLRFPLAFRLDDLAWLHRSHTLARDGPNLFFRAEALRFLRHRRDFVLAGARAFTCGATSDSVTRAASWSNVTTSYKDGRHDPGDQSRVHGVACPLRDDMPQQRAPEQRQIANQIERFVAQHSSGKRKPPGFNTPVWVKQTAESSVAPRISPISRSWSSSCSKPKVRRAKAQPRSAPA